MKILSDKQKEKLWLWVGGKEPRVSPIGFFWLCEHVNFDNILKTCDMY